MHMIDITTGRAAVAYMGETPWHSLGKQMSKAMTFDDWAHESGTDYDVMPAVVQYDRYSLDDGSRSSLESGMRTFSGRRVLYRSDTGTPLGIVGDGYKIVQPKQIREMFRDLTTLGGFELETMGALSDGKRIWVLAKVNDGAQIIGKDRVRRYLLAATSYDGTMSTVLKFVDERVVCHNTITSALGEKGLQYRVHHGLQFDADEAKKFMGVGVSTFDKFVYDMRLLASTPVTREEAEGTTIMLLGRDAPAADQDAVDDKIRDGRAFKRIMSLFDTQIGGDITEGKTAWRWLNAVTQFVDWEKGITPSSRMNSAWFGEGDALKTRALNLVVPA